MKSSLHKLHGGIFITGTDTGVGKTHVTCEIARVLRNEGIDVGVMKPVETGAIAGADDHLRLAEAAAVSDPPELICPYLLREPLAPSVAARIEGKTIRAGVIKKAFQKLLRRHKVVLVEGAGGLMVPLKGKYTYAELIKELSLPVVVVAADRLGVINHTLLTCETLVQKGLQLTGVVLNRMPEFQDQSARYNFELLRRLLNVPVVVCETSLEKSAIQHLFRVLLVKASLP